MLACWFDVLIFAIFIEPYLVYMAYGESGLDNDFDRKDLWYYGGNATKEDEDDWIRLDVTEFTVRLFPLLSKVMVERNLDPLLIPHLRSDFRLVSVEISTFGLYS